MVGVIVGTTEVAVLAGNTSLRGTVGSSLTRVSVKDWDVTWSGVERAPWSESYDSSSCITKKRVEFAGTEARVVSGPLAS